MFPNLKASLAPFILRLGLAAIFLYHGYLKLLWHGGTDWSADLPVGVQLLIAWSEFIGGLAIAVGLLSPVVAAGFAIIMIGAIVTVTGDREFVYMLHFARDLTTGYRFGEVGYEYNFAIIVMCMTLMVLGSGKWSLDQCIANWWKRRKTASTAAQTREPVASMPA
jgi:putative oxidoreductase